MSHYGLFTPNAMGHLNPMLALADALRSRGHRVTFFLLGDAPPIVVNAGFEVVPVGSKVFPAEDYRSAMAQLGTLSGRKALLHTIGVGVRTAAAILEEGAELVSSQWVDGLIIDQVSPAVGTVAEVLGLRSVTVCNALLLNADAHVPPFFTPWQPKPGAWPAFKNRLAWSAFDRMVAPLLQQIQVHRRRLGLSVPRHLSETWSERLQVTQQPETLDFPRRDRPGALRYVGPLRLPGGYPPVDFPWDRLDGRPLIYASLGTLQNRVAGSFRMIAEACAGLGLQLVLSTGRGIDPAALTDLPGEPVVVSYAPQLDLIRRSTLAITHAGLNTVLDALSAGIPLVAIPVTNEQPGIAARVAWSGAGEVLSLRQASSDRLRSLVTRVLTTQTYKNEATRLQDSIKAAGGAPRAAELVEAELDAA